MVLASSAGGMEIEDIAHDKPETLIRASVEPAVGMQAFQAREIAFALGFEAGEIAQAVATILGCYRAFRELDATMVEINPLIVTEDGGILALDAKMSFDDNALFRRPEYRRAARQIAGGSARDSGRRSRPVLCRAGWRHRLYRQRRRARHGDHGHDQALGRRARELPRHRRRRHARPRGQGIPARHHGPERRGRAGQHLRRHQPLRLGGARRGQGRRDRCPRPAACGAPCRHACRGRPRDHRTERIARDHRDQLERGGAEGRRRRPRPSNRPQRPSRGQELLP